MVICDSQNFTDWLAGLAATSFDQKHTKAVLTI